MELCLVFGTMFRIDDNALRSTLIINGITPSDFHGDYSCWMRNKLATLNPARILVMRQRRKLNSRVPYCWMQDKC